MMTEQRTFVMKGLTWANSVTSTALTMMTKQRTTVMKGVTWANSDNDDRAENIGHEGCNMG